MTIVKIRLTKNLPVDESYGMTKGKVFTAIPCSRGQLRWEIILGKEKIGVLKGEAEVVEEKK